MSPRFPCLSMLADTHTCPLAGKLALSVEQQEEGREQKGKGRGKTEKKKDDEKELGGERKKLKIKASLPWGRYTTR